MNDRKLEADNYLGIQNWKAVVQFFLRAQWRIQVGRWKTLYITWNYVMRHHVKSPLYAQKYKVEALSIRFLYLFRLHHYFFFTALFKDAVFPRGRSDTSRFPHMNLAMK